MRVRNASRDHDESRARSRLRAAIMAQTTDVEQELL